MAGEVLTHGVLKRVIEDPMGWTKTTSKIRWRAMGLAIVAGLVPVVASASPASVARGGRLARRYCAACHAVGRQGDSPDPDAPPFRDLRAHDRGRNLDEIVAAALMTGHPPMPQFTAGPSDLDALTEYLESIQTRPEPAPGR